MGAWWGNRGFGACVPVTSSLFMYLFGSLFVNREHAAGRVHRPNRGVLFSCLGACLPPFFPFLPTRRLVGCFSSLLPERAPPLLLFRFLRFDFAIFAVCEPRRGLCLVRTHRSWGWHCWQSPSVGVFGREARGSQLFFGLGHDNHGNRDAIGRGWNGREAPNGVQHLVWSYCVTRWLCL